MNFLVDTHAVIWFITDNLKLPVKAKKIIEDKKNTCYVSIASYWEIGIKHSLGRLDLSADLGEIFQIVEDTGFEILPITPKHILTNSGLEYHHQDPFDRIIISQAITEKLSIISKDGHFEKYKVTVVWK